MAVTRLRQGTPPCGRTNRRDDPGLRLRRRAAPLAVLAVVGVRRRAGHRRDDRLRGRERRARLRRGVGGARLRRDVAAAHAVRAGGDDPAGARAPPTTRRSARRRRRRSTWTTRARKATARASTWSSAPGSSATIEDTAAAARRGRPDRLAAPPRVPRPEPGRGAVARDDRPRAGEDPRARRQHARRGPGGGANLAARHGRSRDRRRAHGADARGRARGALRARVRARHARWARRGSSGSSRSRWPGRPAASCAPGRASSPAPSRSAAEPVRTTIDVGVQEAVATALAGRFGGIAALDAKSGAIRGLAGIAFSAPQPPGSTFKIVTTTAALEEKLVKPKTEFPIETHAIIDGVELENANGESCGGSFANSFAHSCNSVFAPLGVKVGAEKLVETAERYGFNADPAVPGRGPEHAAGRGRHRLPARAGRDRDRAGPRARDAAAARLDGADGRVGRRPAHADRRPRRPARSSRASRRARSRARSSSSWSESSTTAPARRRRSRRSAWRARRAPPSSRTRPTRRTTVEQTPGSDTDAWFTAYAPVKNPEIAVAVLLVRNGAGGETAAPAARVVLQAALAD